MPDGPAPAEGTTTRSQTGREFIISSIFFDNGCFLTITEGEHRLGAISASIGASGGKTTTARIIPSKHDPVFLATISEKVASLINGICLVSLHCKSALQLEDMKAIMEAVMAIIKGKIKDE